MGAETICVNLELAKQLKEAGWDKETVFAWGVRVRPDKSEYSELLNDYQIKQYGFNYNYFYPAPTSAEIPLPNKFSLHYEGVKHCWVTRIMPTPDDHLLADYPEERLYNSEVEAKAKMWLFLKKKGVI